jgi:effector-binding domain-containing protein
MNHFYYYCNSNLKPKIMKKLGLILLVIILLFAFVSAFLPGKIHVDRSITINAPAAKVFGQVNDLTTWKNWSYWDQIDPNMKSEFEGPSSGAGAIHKWTSENDSVGTGSLTIVESTGPNSITTSLTFEQMTSMGGWTFADSPEGTVATIFMDIEMPFYARIFPGLMMNGWLGKDFEKTLAGLKKHCESLPVETAASWEVETLTTSPATAMSIRMTTNMSEISQKLGEAYGKIMESMKKQNLHQSGPVFAIYHKWSESEIEMEPGITVDKAGKDDGDVKPLELKAVKVMKLDYYGDYPGTEKAHYFLDEWAKKNNVNIVGAPWEEYVTDPMSEPDTSKWLTRIFYPVE